MLPVNDTPFVLERFAIFNKDGAETLIVLLKATFELEQGKPPAIAKEQDPVVNSDIYGGEPGKSGIVVEGDRVPPRPGTGVTLKGHAVAREGNQRVEVGLRVGSLTQSAVVHGDRQWDTILGMTRVTSAEPFEKIPLVWENAFGGVDQTPVLEKHWEFELHNPVGKGFLAKKSRKPLAGVPLPNIEHPDQPVRTPRDRPTPVGFCPVAPHWQPRVAFAGTYDDKWREEQAPLFPEDFNPRFYQSAPRGLTSANYFKGGETCVVIGTTRAGRLEFSLPTITPGFRLRWPTGAIRLAPELDTVHIDTDRMRLQLTWRAVSEIHGKLETLEAIEASVNRKDAR
jgi:hypothetical protein